jgi:hypothetical protein
MGFLSGPVNVVELKDGRVSVGHADKFKTVWRVSRRPFDEEVADLETRYVVERRYTVERMVVCKVKVVAVGRR